MRLLKRDDRATQLIVILTLIGVSALCLRALTQFERFNSALLYIGLPYCLSVAVYYLTPQTDGVTWPRRFWNNLRLTLIALFGSSLILMEGYLCVVMFLPIFIFIVLVAFLGCCLNHYFKTGRAFALAIPALALLLSMEGVTELTTFDRTNEVSRSQVIEADAASIRSRLTKPIAFRGERHWFLSAFPLPHYVGTLALDEGEVRRYDFVYHRWFVTNSHRGSIDVTLTEIGEQRIVTAIEDDSYISGYLKLHGTVFALEPLDDGRTRVTLTVSFERLLDPIWYFEPLQRFAVGKGIDYFLSEVLAGGSPNRNETSGLEA